VHPFCCTGSAVKFGEVHFSFPLEHWNIEAASLFRNQPPHPTWV